MHMHAQNYMRKKWVSVYVRSDLVERARYFGLNVSRLLERTLEETLRKILSDENEFWSPGRDLNPGSPAYQAGALATKPPGHT